LDSEKLMGDLNGRFDGKLDGKSMMKEINAMRDCP
jgi:hypothetical protein